MEVLPLSAMFIVCGAHITENLQHHKSKDVKRILEEKGFIETGSHDADRSIQFYVPRDGGAQSKRTFIVFDEQGFVLPGEGVKFYDSPEAAKG